MMPQDLSSAPDLTRTTLGVLFISLLIVSTAWIIRPFLSALLWAAMIVISTWPLMLAVQSRVGDRRGVATALMTVTLLLVLLIPLSLAVGALISNVDALTAKASTLEHLQVPPPPAWVARIPLQGRRLSAEWQRLSEAGPDSLSAQLSPYAGRVLRWLASQIGGVGGMILQFLLIVILCVILYINGETAARGVRRFAARLAGAHGEAAAILAAATIRGVALAVIVTAIVQTVIAGAGLAIAAVPGAALLAAVALMFNLAQLGPWLVMLPAVIWKFYSGDSFLGFVLLIFMLIAGTIDNFLRPLLIRKGADLPLLLIFGGVIGGIISFGFMGIFIGPVILAVTFVLLREWVNNQPQAEKSATASRTGQHV
jgi:predicted PurR-regulated permease PerM